MLSQFVAWLTSYTHFVLCQLLCCLDRKRIAFMLSPVLGVSYDPANVAILHTFKTLSTTIFGICIFTFTSVYSHSLAILFASRGLMVAILHTFTTLSTTF